MNFASENATKTIRATAATAIPTAARQRNPKAGVVATTRRRGNIRTMKSSSLLEARKTRSRSIEIELVKDERGKQLWSMHCRMLDRTMGR